MYALTGANELFGFVTPDPAGVVSGPTAVNGLQPGETLLGLDARPATGQLYASFGLDVDPVADRSTRRTPALP